MTSRFYITSFPIAGWFTESKPNTVMSTKKQNSILVLKMTLRIYKVDTYSKIISTVQKSFISLGKICGVFCLNHVTSSSLNNYLYYFIYFVW